MTEGHKKRTILVVDDLPENIDVLSEILSSEYTIKAAVKGEKALEIAATEPYPDLVLLDIMMPGMDGYEVCQQLKDNEKTRNIPVIFVTAMSDVTDEARGFEVGSVDYVTKPISPVTLKARVKTHIDLKQARDHLEELVDAKTKELQRVNAKLARQVKMMQGRDHLIHFQMKGPTMREAFHEICLVVQKVLGIERVIIFQPDEQGQLIAEILLTKTTINQPLLKPESSDLSPASALVLAAKSFQKEQLVLGEPCEAAVPIMYNHDKIGVLWVENSKILPLQKDDLNALFRLSTEAALVLRAAQVTEDIVGDRINLEELMHLVD